ncbi:hypothetical protein YC2023_032602 [Brassica napus]
MMFGLQRRSSKEKYPQQTISQSSFKYSLNNFDEFVSVQDRPNKRCNEPFKTSQGEADPKRRFLQFDVQEICDNFEKGMMKALKDISKIHMKSTSTRAPVAEPSLFISKKSKGKSETHVEELKDFSDSLPTFDEYDEEPIESLMICEKNCDLPSLESEFMNDNEQTIVELTVLQPEHPSSLVLSQQVFEEEPLDYPHQGPRLDTRNPLDEDLGHIFDGEGKPGPVFDEEATSITSIVMESHLCFDPGTTPAHLTPDLQEHCEKSDLINSLPNMFVKISSHDLICFGLDRMKDFCVSKSVFENMIYSFKLFKPEKLLDQKCFQKGNGIKSEFILSFDQFLKHSKGFDRFEKSLELDLKQTDFCDRKSFDSFVFKKNSFDLSSSKHAMITDNLIASSCALDDFLIKKMLEHKSLETEIDFCDLDFCDYVLQFDLLSSETDKIRHSLRSILDNCVVLSLDDIVVYNTFFEKHLESLIVVSQSEHTLLCSAVEKDMQVLKINNIIVYLDKILYLSCTFDPALLASVLSVQERQVQPLRDESIDRAQQPEIWRSFVVQTGYLGDARDKGSVQNGYLNFQKVVCHESNFLGKPTHQGFTEAWNHLKIFTEEGVMKFPNRRFSCPSIREYQTFKGDLGPRKKRSEPKPILHEPKSTSCPNQKHCKDHGLIVSDHHESVLNPRISKRKHIFTWLKNVLLKPCHELFSMSYALKEIWRRKKHEPKLLRPIDQFDFFTCLMLAHVLDDYPKSLDPVFDVLRIEKPFDYFFIRFDVVSLVVLKEQNKHDHFPRRASNDGRQKTWNYLMKTTSKTPRKFLSNLFIHRISLEF